MKKYILIVLILSTFIINSTYAELTVIQKQAAIDAKTDVDIGLWLITGFSISGIGFCTGCYTGLVNAEGSSGGLEYYPTDVNLSYAIGCSALIDIISPLLILVQKPTVPPYRLLGKSPEYVWHYSKTYRKSVRIQRLKWTAIGSLTGFGVCTGFILWFDSLE
ncbi:hypothetical protein C6497_02540 [Candidatus Poribacteria bacterium]|nr:MAG: hypothetical protein C6497_02540 [Candidatus Poribacteria bacterium]